MAKKHISTTRKAKQQPRQNDGFGNFIITFVLLGAIAALIIVGVVAGKHRAELNAAADVATVTPPPEQQQQQNDGDDFAIIDGGATGTIFHAFLFPAAPSVAPPTNPPPAHIRVGPYLYDILWTSDDFPSYARTDYMHRTITLRASLEPGDLRETLLHELMHAAADLSGTHFYDTTKWDDDAFIEATIPAMLDIMHDNPALVEWLMRKRFATSNVAAAGGKPTTTVETRMMCFNGTSWDRCRQDAAGYLLDASGAPAAYVIAAADTTLAGNMYPGLQQQVAHAPAPAASATTTH